MVEHITTAGNTLVPMVLALRALGFSLTRTEDGEWDHWTARRDDLVLTAGVEEFPALLALALMRQVRGPDWKASDHEIDAVLEEFGGI